MHARSVRRSSLVTVVALAAACGSSHDPTDAGGRDAGLDAAGRDAATDAGADAGPDPGRDGGGTDAGGGCSPACGEGRTCCGGACVNPGNDSRHCGACDTPCGAGTACLGGSCTRPPCNVDGGMCTGGATCCGSSCCGAGEICCDPQGPIDFEPQCTTPDPETGVCPQGCAPLCMCASPDTPIATPSGDRPIAELRVGDLVYSVDRGASVAVPIARTSRRPVQDHHVVRVTLATGAVLEISARHPTADGRLFGDLRAMDRLDGIGIVTAEVVPYAHDATYDILPASETGLYYAAGALVGSTLAP
jgi:hypothetical protein